MIYLAILLILSGLLIVITAFFIEKAGEEVNDYGETANNSGRSADADFEDMEIIFPGDRIDGLKKDKQEEDVFITFDDEIADTDDADVISDKSDWGIEANQRTETDKETGVENHKQFDDGSDHKPLELGTGKNSVSAVMFDDRSNIIDYESGGSMIDSTFTKYKSIKRIGKGQLETDSDGLNFFLDEKLYRFDFYKVYDIWSGSNFVALPLKGSSTVKLFLIENPEGFPERVEENFKEYEKGL
jgi:hypothetical protein